MSEWSERGRTGAQEVNGGCLGMRTEGGLRVRERRRRNVGKRTIRRVGGRGVRVEGVCLGRADGRATRGWTEGWAERS